MAKVNHLTSCITFAFFALMHTDPTVVTGYTNGEEWYQEGPCRYAQKNGNGIDISPVENITTAGLRFLTTATNDVVYFFHPCSDFPVPTTQHTDCSTGCTLCLFKATSPNNKTLNVDAVRSGAVNGTFHNLAHSGQAVFQSYGKDFHVVYKNGNITTTLCLECERTNSEISITDPHSPFNLLNHSIILKSPYSCIRDLKPGTHQHTSVAAVFFGILFTLALAYFFGGMLVLRHIKGATGTEMIPNYDFWVSLPHRIKDLFMRLIGRGSAGPETYERI